MVIIVSAVCGLAFLLIASILAFCVPINSTPVNSFSNETISNKIEFPIVSSLSFPSICTENYAERMADAQPFSNNRLLDGNGKNHTLNALAIAVSSDTCSVISVLKQVGDTFS